MDKLSYPNKSHRKAIAIPTDSVELAELMGIVFGDGGINNDWQLVITLNAIADLEYSEYVKYLLNHLFNINVSERIRKGQNARVLVCSGMNLVDYLVQKGSVRGNKVKQQINTPDWINKNPEYQKAFVRGLMDTDGCLYIHTHSIKERLYHNLGLCFTNFSKKLITSVADIFCEFGIKPYITNQGTRIYLYSKKAVIEYIKIFGTSNERIDKKVYEWASLHKIANFGEVS